LIAINQNDLPGDIRGEIFNAYLSFELIEQGYGDWSMANQDYEKLLALGSEYKRFVDSQ